MKAIAILLAGLGALLADVTPRSGSFSPKRLGEERAFEAPGLWLIAPGGRYIATSTGASEFGLIDAATGKDFGRLGDHAIGGRHDGNFGQSDRVLATTSNEGSVKVWDAATRKEVASLEPHSGFT